MGHSKESRNKVDFWTVHGMMNTSGLLQTLQVTRSIHHSMNSPKSNLLLIINILYIEIMYNLGNKTVLYLLCINVFVGV